MQSKLALASGILMLASVTVPAGDGTPTMVFCAPGYPGSTEQAQETMDDLAAVVGHGAGLQDGELHAEYHEAEDAGIARLGESDALIAVVTLPFYLVHRDELDLRPVLAGVNDGTTEEIWTLVAPVGLVQGPADLAEWEVTGVPGYSAAFVRGVALENWGAMPTTANISFTKRPLSALRRASRGETVAVLLDVAQADALPSLPFADQLEVVARSRPVPGSVVCTLGDRSPGLAARILKALESLPAVEGGPGILETIRLDRFEPVDPGALAAAEAAFGRALGDESR